jgi:tetraacyldisaccharide 4'-kinase
MLRIILFPFAVLYDLVTRIRNYLYDRGLKPSVGFDVITISVGNLTVGGTGKTPMIEHLIRILRPEYPVATLSRGYGRNTKGFRLAGKDDNATTIGDEPFQIYKKYGEKVKVAVCEDRAFAIPNILQDGDEDYVILMDDAYQHRRVRPTFSILLSDFNRPFYNDFLLPAGRLRESRSNAKRANAVVISKCPHDISDDTMMEIEKYVRRYASAPVFFTKIHYGEPVSFGKGGKISDKVILVSGIAYSRPLKSYVTSNFSLITHLDFPDHYTYQVSDIASLEALAAQHPDASILTTEKDMVKLDVSHFQERMRSLPIFYLPVETEFIKNGEDFDAMVVNVVKRSSQTTS